MKIRKAEEKDREVFIEVYTRNFSQTDKETAKDLFEEKLSNPMQGLVLLAEEDNKVVGLVAVDIIDLMGHIVGLCVEKDYRQRGIGTALVKEAIDRTRKLNQNVRHIIMTGGKYTVKIAQKFGFEATDRFLLVKYL